MLQHEKNLALQFQKNRSYFTTLKCVVLKKRNRKQNKPYIELFTKMIK